MTLVDESYLTPCPRCGAVVLARNQATHAGWHQLLERVATDVQDLTRAIGAVSRVAQLQWKATQQIAMKVGELNRAANTSKHFRGLPPVTPEDDL